MLDDFSLPSAQRGTVTKKGFDYLNELRKETSETKTPNHPRHHGIKMQAHHAISEKGISLLSYADKFADFGYNINWTTNLVFIPSTLPGACMLGVQPHRGNHTAPSATAPDIDSLRENTYHGSVSEFLQAAYRVIKQKCGDNTSNVAEETKKEMNKVSAKIIKFIQRKPEEFPLTHIAENFKPGDKRGCGGATSVTVRSQKLCPHDRKHTGHEGITYVCTTPYTLTPGN